MTQTLEGRGTRRATGVERHGWVLVALLCLVMVVFGAGAYFGTQDPDTPIVGSMCCNGERLSTVDAWVYAYAGEMAKYMGTYMAATGIFGLVLCAVPLRRGERWAWWTAWTVPALFAVHGFALGSFPFDIVPLALTTLGLLLMARPVLGGGAGPAREEA
jgi:hypothetical protein